MSYKRGIKLDLAIIFTLALALRLIYLGNLESLVFQEGDAYYYLKGGESLLSFIQEAWHGHVHDLSALGTAAQTDAQAMCSTRLADRILIDGPIVTSFMALFEGLAGFKPGLENFDSKFRQIAALLCVWQAFGCVFVYLSAYLAFGNKHVARFSSLLMALYPAAIINVQSCYSELICFPLFSLWLLCLVALRLNRFAIGNGSTVVSSTGKDSSAKIPAYLFTGFVSAMVMLSKPVFLVAPLLLCPCLFTYRGWTKDSLLKQIFSPAMLSLFAGLALVFTPWLLVTNTVAGRPLISVNRAPAFNLAIGNCLSRNGWGASPVLENIPSAPKQAVANILGDLVKHPTEMVTLEASKFPRLFVGSWNEFQRKLFGLPPHFLDFWHQIVLAFAVLGVALGFASTRKNERRFTALFAAAIALHFTYLLVEPISRYNFTLAPVFSILASFALLRLFELECLPLAIITIPAIIFALSKYRAVCQLFAQSLSFSASRFLTAGFYFLLIAALFAGLCYFLIKRESRPLRALLSCLLALPLAAVFALCVLGERQLGNWPLSFNKDCHLKQVFKLQDLPVSRKDARLFLLVDMKCDISPYPLKLKVNGKSFKSLAFPWQMVARDENFLNLLDIQMRGMNGNPTTLRQWWAVPIANGLFDCSGENTVELSAAAERTATVFGSFAGTAEGSSSTNASKNPGQTLTYMPSEKLSSWTKGFTTWDREDFRLYLPQSQSATHSYIWREDKWQDEDLSKAPLLQKGNFNIKVVAIDPKCPVPKQDSARNLVFLDKAEVQGAYPISSNLAQTKIGASERSPGSICIVSGHASATGKNRKFVIQLFFETKDKYKDIDAKEGRIIAPSHFQPSAIELKGSQPNYFSFADFTTPLAATELNVKLTALPYQPSLLYLQKRKALKENLSLKDLRLDLIEESGLAPGESASCTQLNY